VGDTKFTMASGEVVRAKEIVIKEVKIGNQFVRDVKAAAIPGEIDLLLGVDVLNAIGPYLIDSQNSQLIFAFPSKYNASYISSLSSFSDPSRLARPHRRRARGSRAAEQRYQVTSM